MLFSSLCLLLAAAVDNAPAGAADAPFAQEYHEGYSLGDVPGANDVRGIVVAPNGDVWAATKAGAYRLKGREGWEGVKGDMGPAFDVVVDVAGTVWIAAWNGVYRADGDTLEKIEGIDAPVAALCIVPEGVVGAGPEGLWRIVGTKATREDLPSARGVRAVMSDAEGGLWIATGMGLFHHGGAKPDFVCRTEDELLSCDVKGIASGADGALWIGGLGGVTLYKDEKRVGDFTTETALMFCRAGARRSQEGLPSVYVQCVACGPDGRMWVGTDMGVTRYDGKTWSLRHSRRWLMDDDVRDVAFASDGTAWMATAKGVSAIRTRTMTLEEKAAYYYDICMKRHVRDPWLVEKCILPTPGDTSRWEPMDDDNDGQYTGMYLAMESYRYAVTKAPDAKENARKAFETLCFLQEVTDTPGFIARTVVPSTWTKMHDPGDVLTETESAEQRIGDPRYKPVAQRWRPSKDGKWLWKGDTSSDEITGHFYWFGQYYDLAAEEPEREKLRTLVRRVMDYIIDGGYVLKDIDGTHTRWGVWVPERLNHDPDWAAERGINSVEILSYLKTTYHVTKDEKYQKEYLRLLHEEGYAENVRHAKTYAPAWRTHIDDELLALTFPGLIKYEDDPELSRLYRESVEYWYPGIQHEYDPYFNFTYGSFVGKDPQLDDSIAFLRDAPLDLVNWTVDNSKREDLRLVRAPLLEPLQTSRMVPASERGVVRWDKNLWEAVQGDGGQTEWCPVFWLLPYWMGRYNGFIQAPK